MRIQSVPLDGQQVQVVTVNTAIVGTGAAGYQAATQLYRLGQTDIAMVTEGVTDGTSRNTGSDKQTYYKLSLWGEVSDSPRQMAKDLFAGKGVDGDVALVEAALSVPCFLNLQRLGVPFPATRYGEFVGYKTDHDPRARATSAGPLTSQMMTRVLQQEAEQLGIPVFDQCQVIAVLTDQGKAVGLLALNKAGLEDEASRYILFNCTNIVYATGGPAGIYQDVVYPTQHFGGSGPAFRAGAVGKNLTEWQFGLASTAPRWNVSGTYMQVLPRMISIDADGVEHEFLAEYFQDQGQMLSLLFQKGYQWPFDCRKVLLEDGVPGSSLIDLLVYRETVLKNRRVYLDFLHNPGHQAELDYSLLSEEARQYLEQAGACFGTPIQRLQHMNQPAVDLYASKGVDITREYLPIALCAQHNNGGLEVDLWWQTNIRGLYAAGEVAGTHGVYRPGGSALNAGQVGGLRAAQHIAVHGTADPLPLEQYIEIAASELAFQRELVQAVWSAEDNTAPLLEAWARQMSAVAGPIRRAEEIQKLISERVEQQRQFQQLVRINEASSLPRLYRLYDILLCQRVYLEAMLNYLQTGGGSRGSSLYYDPRGRLPAGLEELFRFSLDGGERDQQVQQTVYADGGCRSNWRPVRPLPEGGEFFETVWREFRENNNHGNIY